MVNFNLTVMSYSADMSLYKQVITLLIAGICDEVCVQVSEGSGNDECLR